MQNGQTSIERRSARFYVLLLRLHALLLYLPAQDSAPWNRVAKEGAEIIVDNTQDILFGGFAPNSSSAEVLSKALGSRTVLSGSVSRSKNDPAQSLQMIERPLLTPDELKSLPKGEFIVMKTGVHPMRTRLKLYFKWGIFFDAPYTVPDRGNRRVEYMQRGELEAVILRKYPSESRRPLRLRSKQEVPPDA